MKKFFTFAALVGACAVAPAFAQENTPARPARAAQEQATQNGQAQPLQQGERAPAQPQLQPGQRPQIQQPAVQPGERVQAQKPAVQDTQKADFNHEVAACLIIANQAEVALAEASVEKLQNPQAREFAQQLVKDHTQFVSKLKQHAPQAANLKLNVGQHSSNDAASRDARNAETTANATDRDSASPTDPAHATAGASARSASESSADKWLRVQKASAENCVNMTLEKLQAMQGVEFDKAFLGSQIAGHVNMIAHLKALEGEVDGEVKTLITDAQKSTKEHLQHAEKLMKELKDVEPGDKQAREDRSESRDDSSNRQDN